MAFGFVNSPVQLDSGLSYQRGKMDRSAVALRAAKASSKTAYKAPERKEFSYFSDAAKAFLADEAARYDSVEEIEALPTMEPYGDNLKWQFWYRPRFPQYSGFVFRVPRRKQIRIRAAMLGTPENHIFHFQVLNARQEGLGLKSGKYIEYLGYYDPNLAADHPRKFFIKADRVIHYLREGAWVSPKIVDLMDWIGILKRTGIQTRRGFWEWRIDPNCGPNIPDGWSWDGPQKVTFNSRIEGPERLKVGPNVHVHEGKLRKWLSPKKKWGKERPLIEKYGGFLGYDKIPIDSVTVADPLVKQSLLKAFPNTDLPMY